MNASVYVSPSGGKVHSALSSFECKCTKRKKKRNFRDNEEKVHIYKVKLNFSLSLS